jgi:acyl-CoA carboxylase subunit beta
MLVYGKRLERNLRVCPECSHHLVLSARNRLALLLDTDSFDEHDADLSPSDPLGFVDTKPYPVRLAESSQRTGGVEAALWGTGAIGDQPVVVCALDFTFLGGSMGSVVGEKVTRAIEYGAETKTPVLVCSASGGARMQEGPLSLMQMAKTAGALARLADEGVPFVSILTDPTYGGVSASFAMLGDVIIAEPAARAGFAGPSVIEQTIRQKLPSGFQTAEFLLEKGQIDLIATRGELRATLTKLLAYHHRAPARGTPRAPSVMREYRAAPGADQPAHPEPACAWEVVRTARHEHRPRMLDFVKLMFDDFIELHGDRAGHDDRAIVGGLATIDGWRVMIVGHQRGSGTRENIRYNFGMPHPEGYRKARRLMEYAGRFGLPLLTFIDTPGAYPGLQAEERNQSEAIARALVTMSRLPVPVVCTVIGEGGSGGALAIGVGNRVLMLENATYSVISPEGCATILFKDAASAPRAAQALRLTARELVRLGIADDVVPEAPGGAHTNPSATAAALKEALVQSIAALATMPGQALIEHRYARFRAFGEYLESAPDASDRDEAAA